MNQGNIMYVNNHTMQFGRSNRIYKSIKEFNDQYKMFPEIFGLYRLGDYKKMRSKDVKDWNKYFGDAVNPITEPA